MNRKSTFVSHRRSSGFTLLELMIVVTIAAILLAVGVPGLRDVIVKNRLSSSGNVFVSSVNAARSEAVKRGVSVSLRQQAAGWQGGWCIAEGAPGDCSGTLIRNYPALTNINTVSTNSIITFSAKGYVTTTADTVTFCTTGESDGRQVTVSAIGQPRVFSKGDCP